MKIKKYIWLIVAVVEVIYILVFCVIFPQRAPLKGPFAPSAKPGKPIISDQPPTTGREILDIISDGQYLYVLGRDNFQVVLPDGTFCHTYYLDLGSSGRFSMGIDGGALIVRDGRGRYNRFENGLFASYIGQDPLGIYQKIVSYHNGAPGYDFDSRHVWKLGNGEKKLIVDQYIPMEYVCTWATVANALLIGVAICLTMPRWESDLLPRSVA